MNKQQKMSNLIKAKKHFMSAYDCQTVGKRLNAAHIMSIMPNLVINNGFKTVKNSVILTDKDKSFVICKHYRTIIFIKDGHKVKFLWDCSQTSNTQIYYILQHLNLPYDRKFILGHSINKHMSYSNDGWNEHIDFKLSVKELKEQMNHYV